VFTGDGSSWSQAAELAAPNGEAGDGFASAIALSGTTAVFGAPEAGTSGAAYVFTGAGSGWSEQAELSEGASGSAGDGFGTAVALTGTTAFIGAPGRTSATGAVYLFAFEGGSWVQQATLAASNGQTGYDFGISLAVSTTTALIGSSSYGINTGTVYVFTQSGGSWEQSTQIEASAPHTIGNKFGYSVSLSGTTAVVGAYGRDAYMGAGFVFAPGKKSSWTQSAELVASDGQGGGDLFGRSVALFGTTLVVGAPGHHGDGAAYIYTLDGSTWTLATELSDPGATAGDLFGESAAISGRNVIIGAPGNDDHTGTAYVYNDSATGWSLRSTLTASDHGNGNEFGNAVALSGPTAVVGADGRNHFAGAAYVFSSSGKTWSQVQELGAADGAKGDDYGWAVGVSPSAIVVGAPGYDTDAGIAYFYGFNGATWTLQSELAGSNDAAYTFFGSGVAVSGTTAVVGARGHNNTQAINEYTGTAYVFGATDSSWAQQAELNGTDLNPGAFFGTAVAISPQGTTVAVGAPAPARAYVFKNSGGTWSQTLAQTGNIVDMYGNSVAVSGTTLVVGGPGINSRAGGAFVTS
jgi:hypothetical protein